MHNLPFDQPGQFYRGNLHTHSTNSDGRLPLPEVVRKYREAGYDFVAMTEHFMPAYDYRISDTRDLRTDDFTTLISAELHQGHTSVGERWHILAVGLPVDFEKPHLHETAPEIARRAADAGAFIGIVHPSWYGLTTEDAKTIDCAHAIEIYNHGSQVEVDRGEDWPFCDALLNEGWHLNGFATDDAHQLTHDWLGGWVNVLADSLDPDALLTSLKQGRFYSSQGPEIRAVRIEGMKFISHALRQTGYPFKVAVRVVPIQWVSGWKTSHCPLIGLQTPGCGSRSLTKTKKRPGPIRSGLTRLMTY